ncbi:MAG: hypothetical protein LC740_00170, partial [Actinobacteria bacterium]|nr:hypothetical protein [Actinomycetota bacterium]
DLVDLRRHVEPQVIKERAQQRMMKYIRGVRISASGGRQQSTLAALVVLAAVAALVLRRGNGRDG